MRLGRFVSIPHNLPASRVVRVLDRIEGNRDYPLKMRMDNGPELVSLALAQWAEEHSNCLSSATRKHAGDTSDPCFILFQHCVQDGQQFSDAGRKCNFFGLSCGNQACIELFNYWVVPYPDQGLTYRERFGRRLVLRIPFGDRASCRNPCLLEQPQ